MGTGRPLAGPSTITFKRGCLLCLSLPSPTLSAHSTSHTEATSQPKMSHLQNPPETTYCGTRFLGPRALFLLGPLWHGMALSLQGLCDCPQQTAICAAVHSSDAPGSQNENKGEAVLDKEYQRVGWWSVCFQACPKASFDTKGKKMKSSEKTRHPGDFLRQVCS